MDEIPFPFELSAAATAIAQLLTQSGRPSSVRSHAAGFRAAVVSLSTDDFATLADFKQAYLACQTPLLCVARAIEVPEILSWLRESDDIALIEESETLTNWRLDRIAKAQAQRMDPLTQVHRRGELVSSLKSACQIASPDQPVSLILLDLDHFKILNDRLGVHKGDEIVGKLGRLVHELCRDTLVARTRGGEFGILVENHESLAVKIADMLRRAVTGYAWWGPNEITASFGVADVSQACEPSLLLSRADEALFAAKANGRNRVVCYSEIARISNRRDEELDVISMENKARVLSERVTSFVTQRSKRIMQSLRREANTDGLTQLFNRRYLDKQLSKDFDQAVASGKDLCVALIDLDHFGIVNKKHGWPTGDKVLRSVAETILRSIRNSDWVGRYGGEEICLVMPSTGLEAATIVCERIRSTIESMPFETTAGESMKITLSIGLVELNPVIDPNVTALIERVSQLTLGAKTGGRNRVQTR